MGEGHEYTSTACVHKLHHMCRLSCKYCRRSCLCECHGEVTPFTQLLKAERIAQQFHEAYERLAPQHGYETREESRTTWKDVPTPNRELMIAVAAELLHRGVI